MLRFANLETDVELLEWAQQQAVAMWHDTPELAELHIQRWLGSKAEFLKA